MAGSPSYLRRLGLRLGAMALAVGALSGCQSIDVNANNAAQVRYIQASPDAPGIDFYANNTALAYNVGFGYQMSAYSPLNPGTYTLAADTANTRQVLVASNATLTAARSYTVITSNVLANLQETVLQDQSTPAPSGEISVRFIDEATRVGAVDVYLVPSTGKLTTSSAIVTDVSFGTNTGYINIPAGTYSIAVVPTGTVPVATTVTLLSGPQVGYAPGAVRTVVLIDQKVTTTPGIQAVVADDFDSPSS